MAHTMIGHVSIYAEAPQFVPVEGGSASGAGSHVNLVVPMSASEVDAACANTGLPFGWRWPGLMDLWLEDRLMVELVPAG